jgi:hypothetical protein
VVRKPSEQLISFTLNRMHVQRQVCSSGNLIKRCFVLCVCFVHTYYRPSCILSASRATNQTTCKFTGSLLFIFPFNTPSLHLHPYLWWLGVALIAMASQDCAAVVLICSLVIEVLMILAETFLQEH